MSLKAYLHTLALWQADPRFLPSNDENVALPCSERVANSIPNVDNVETTVVAFPVGDYTDTSHITTASCHRNDTGIEADELGDFAGGQLNLDCVVDLDRWIWVTDPTTPHISFLIFRECHQNLVQRLNDAAELTFAHRA